MIIGLSGYARAGKDEAAKVLVQEFGFTRLAFADKLRDCLAALDPLVAPTPEGYFVRPKNPVRLSEVLDIYGWDGYKNSMYADEIRRLLQRLGTEVGREQLGDNVWVDAVLNQTDPGKDYVIADTRFPNESLAIEERGGTIWRITRAGIGPANEHKSETGLDDWPWTLEIHNDGSLESFKDTVRALYREEYACA